jgi:hypothetical protein
MKETPMRLGLALSAAALLTATTISVAPTAGASSASCGIHAVPGSTEIAVGFTPAKVSMSVWIDTCKKTVYVSSTSFKDSGGYFFKGKESIVLDVINPPGTYGPPSALCAAPGIACDTTGIPLSVAPHGGTAEGCYTTYNGNFFSHPNGDSSDTFCTPRVSVP